MTSPRTNTAAAITPPASSITQPLHLHSITNPPSLHPMCGDRQTWPRLGHPLPSSQQQHGNDLSTIVASFMVTMRSYSPPSASAFRRLNCRCGWAVGMAIMWVYFIINSIFLCSNNKNGNTHVRWFYHHSVCSHCCCTRQSLHPKKSLDAP
jgi:hypothetical protein